MTYTPDETDRRIIALLQSDGRMPNVHIAHELGVAEGTVRRRLERLLGDGLIRVMAISHPTLFSAATRVYIGVAVDLPLIEHVAAHLAEIPEIQSVFIVTGGYDIMVEVTLTSNDGLLSFLMEKLAAVPGVIRTDTLHVLKTVKQDGVWVTPRSFAGQTTGD
jgi:Lrp/AsnC family transcriptional regulator for asnA, asnC and gidA